MKISKLILAVALCGALSAVAPKAGAISLSIGDTHELGFINYGIPAGDSDITSYLNHLIGMSLSSANSFSGQDFTRSSNLFSPLGSAVLASRTTSGFSGATVNVTSGYQYLMAKYDGPNYGTEVWYIGNLTGTITIPSISTGKGYGISGYALFTPNGTVTNHISVPDAGSTALLLGAVLSGLGMMARRIK